MSDVMSDEKWEEYWPGYIDFLHKRETSTQDIPDKRLEKEYLDKLVNDHWAYIEGVLYNAIQEGDTSPLYNVNRISEIEYHYKSSAKHFWSHAREYHVGDTL